MDVDWGKILMDPVVQGAIIGAAGAVALAALAGFFKIVLSFRDKKLFDEIKTKIGNHKSDTLEGQHDDIKNIIVDKTNNLKEINTNEFNRIYVKVDSIDKEIAVSKEKHNNLNLDQKSVKNNVEKLVYDWERLITENIELKGRITELEKKNNELIEVISKFKKKEKSKDLEL